MHGVRHSLCSRKGSDSLTLLEVSITSEDQVADALKQTLSIQATKFKFMKCNREVELEITLVTIFFKALC